MEIKTKQSFYNQCRARTADHFTAVGTLPDGNDTGEPGGRISEWLWTKVPGPVYIFINVSAGFLLPYNHKRTIDDHGK